MVAWDAIGQKEACQVTSEAGIRRATDPTLFPREQKIVHFKILIVKLIV